MINPAKIRRMVGIFISLAITVGALLYAGIYYLDNTVMFITISMIAITISFIIAMIMTSNTMTQIAEGKGLGIWTIDSTGIINPFICKVIKPFIKANIPSIDGNEEVKHLFDRKATFRMATPKKITSPAQMDDNGNLHIIITRKELQEGRFGLFNMPCFIWNDMTKTIVTKDFLSDQEKTVFAEYNMMLLNRHIDDLGMYVKNMARYMMEQTMPLKNLFQNKAVKWITIITVIGVAIFILYYFISTGGVNFGSMLPELNDPAIVTPR